MCLNRDRVRRIGQTKPVKSIWISAFDLDRHIDSMLEQKKQTAAAVLDGSAEAFDDVPKKSILQTLQEVLPRIAKNDCTASNDGMKQTSMLQFTQPSPNK